MIVPLAFVLMREPGPAALVAALIAAAFGLFVRRRLGMRAEGDLTEPLRPWAARAWGGAAAAIAWPLLFSMLTEDWQPGGWGGL